VEYKVNSSSPRTEHWGMSQNMGTAYEKLFLIFIDRNLFTEHDWIQVNAVSDMPN